MRPLSKILEKIYRFDGTDLYLKKKKISLEIYMKLMASKNLLTLNLSEVTVCNSNGSRVPATTLLKYITAKDLTL